MNTYWYLLISNFFYSFFYKINLKVLLDSLFKNVFPKNLHKFKYQRSAFSSNRKKNERINFLANWFYVKKKSSLNNFFFFYLTSNLSIKKPYEWVVFYQIFNNYKTFFYFFILSLKKTFGEGYYYIRGLILIFIVDASVTDDEPLWEPLEWSLVQTWIFFIFMFAWIAENLITSRYGSYTGRDKRVWFAWYKSFWLIECWFALSYGTAALFVIVPFYYELTYNISFVFSWWNWYTRVFFFKFISTYTVILLLSYFFLINIRVLNWKKLFLMVLVINFFIAYLLYTNFIISFFGYFTDPLWYQKTRFIDYIQLSHEPLKWGWGPSKRDHFTYHKVSTVFWFKNDGPFAGAFLMIHLFFFLSIFFLYIYWIVLLRRIYTTKEVSYTYSTYCVSSLRQFFYFFFLFYLLVIVSFLVNYWRFPIEFLWIVNSGSWFLNFFYIFKDYLSFLISIF